MLRLGGPTCYAGLSRGGRCLAGEDQLSQAGGEDGVKAVLELEHIHGEQYSHLFHGQLLLEKGGSYYVGTIETS